MTAASTAQRLPGHHSRGEWANKSLAYLEQVTAILAKLRQYWPLTLRQVFYQLVAAGEIDNNRNQYQKLSRLLTKARMDCLVPWEAIEDRTRSRLPSLAWPNADIFVQDTFEDFLKRYRRDLLQSQPIALEIWLEKDALSRVCYRAAFPYCVDVIVARGFSSISYLHSCRERVENNRSRGKPTHILYFGDLDPSGWEMLPAMMNTLQVEMKLGDWVRSRRCALNPEQVFELDLPRSIDAMKNTDPRTPKYKAMLRHTGYSDNLAVELDALPPAALEGLVRQAVEEVLDLSDFHLESEKERIERGQIAALRKKVHEVIKMDSKM